MMLVTNNGIASVAHKIVAKQSIAKQRLASIDSKTGTFSRTEKVVTATRRETPLLVILILPTGVGTARIGVSVAATPSSAWI